MPKKKIIEKTEPVEEREMKLDFILDDWQKEVLKENGNLCICSGRQVGKSQIIAIKAGEFIAKNPKKKVLIISITEDQAQNMLQKTLLYLHDNYPRLISKGKDKPTKHKIHLTNGAEVVTKAVGQYGLGVLGMTVDVVIPDECAYLPEAIWQSITPMLLTTGGVMWLLSTPNLQEGYFYKAYTDPTMGFKTFHVNSEQVADKRPEPQRTIMLEHLAREKARMTDLEYAQQYLAQFLEEIRQMFPNELIDECCTEDYHEPEGKEYYCGVDIARMGKDETTFEIFERKKDKLYHRDNKIHKKLLTTETSDKLIEEDARWKFKKIYIDDGGIGAAVYDQLLEHPQTMRKITPLNNATKSLDRDNNHTRKLFKEDLYTNLLRLMQKGRIKLINDEVIKTSLRSIMAESNKQGDLRIYGRYTHIVEGIIRAAWAIKDRKLNIFIF